MKESEVVWALAHIGPATASEVDEFMESDTASTAVLNTWRNGLLVRRKREKPNHMGPDPYEYALAPARDEPEE